MSCEDFPCCGHDDFDDYDDWHFPSLTESMDGDWDSGMAGFGMDEDYGYYGDETDF